MSRVVIVGTGQTEFGELWDRSWVDLVEEAGLQALLEAGIEKKRINKLFLGNMSLGMFGGQEHSASKIFSEIFHAEHEPEVLGKRVEGACASGGLALESAYSEILAGLQKDEDSFVLVGGVEKMTDRGTEEAIRILGAASDVEKEIGFTFPAFYGNLKDRYLYETDAEEDDFHRIAVKSHVNANANPKAQYSFRISLDKARKSPEVSDPVRLMNSSGIADGAAALILTTERRADDLGLDYIVLDEVKGRNDTIGLFERTSPLTLESTKRAAEAAYSSAGTKPSDVDVAEVHDCFSIAEALALEDLGFCDKQRAWNYIRNSLPDGVDRDPPVPYDIDGHRIYVNTSGGLKAKGHPVGATGIAQAVEIVNQLKGKCKERQTPDPKTGLTHNVGGSGGTAVVSLYQKP